MPPTSFTNVSDGQTILAAHLNQFAGPINTLEIALANGLGSLGGVTIGSPLTGQYLRRSPSGWENNWLQWSDMPVNGFDASKIATGLVTNAEFLRLAGVTSGIQSQIDGKAASSHSHSAGDITSGTLGVARGGTGLASLGTAGQSLRVNAGGSALEYYTPSGGGGSSPPFAISDTTGLQTALDARLPLAGGTLTGAVLLTGTHADPSSSQCGWNRNASGSQAWWCPSGAGFGWYIAGSQFGYLNAADGFVLGMNGSANSAAYQWYRTNGFQNWNIPNSATGYQFLKNGSRIGGFPLTPGDMPSQRAIFRRITSNQTASASYALTVVGFNSTALNENSNLTLNGDGSVTCNNAGLYDFDVCVGTDAAFFLGFAVNRGSATTNYMLSLASFALITGDVAGSNSITLSLAATDKVEVIVLLNSGNIKYVDGASRVPAGEYTVLRVRRVQ